eukprot:g8040.t1
MSSKEDGDDSEETPMTPEEEIQMLRFSLKEAQDNIADLKLQVSEKDNQISDLKKTQQSLKEQQQEEIKLFTEEIKALKDERAHDEVLLVEEINRLKQDNAHIGDVENANRRLTDRVGELLSELEKRGRNFAEESHRVKNDAFNLRIQLESTFRKSLHEMDAKYKEDAFQSLSNDSKNALIENSKLEKELTIQSIGIEALLKRYNAQLTMYRELKVENEILVKKDRLQSNEVRALKQERLAAEARVASLQENMNELNALQVRAGKLEQELEKTSEELTQVKNLATKYENKAEKWKSRAFEMSQQMLEQSSSRVLASQGGSMELPNNPMKNSRKKNYSYNSNDPVTDNSYGGNATAIWNSRYSEASPTRNSPSSSIPGLPLVASTNVHEEMGPGNTGIVQSRFKYQNKRQSQQRNDNKMKRNMSTNDIMSRNHYGRNMKRNDTISNFM